MSEILRLQKPLAQISQINLAAFEEVLPGANVYRSVLSTYPVHCGYVPVETVCRVYDTQYRSVDLSIDEYGTVQRTSFYVSGEYVLGDLVALYGMPKALYRKHHITFIWQTVGLTAYTTTNRYSLFSPLRSFHFRLV